MGMLLHRHLVEADLANKPVESEAVETVQEMPKDIEQAVVEEVTPEEPIEAEPEKEEKPKRKRTVAKKPVTRKLTRKSK